MTDRPDEQKLEVQETNKTPEKAGQESTIGDDSKQKTWGTANEVSHQNDVHPSEVEGVKALDSFGIDFGNGTVETAKGKEALMAAQELEPSSDDSISLGGRNYQADDQLLVKKTNNQDPLRQVIDAPHPAGTNIQINSNDILSRGWHAFEQIQKGLNDLEQSPKVPAGTAMDSLTGLIKNPEKYDQPRWRDVDLKASKEAYKAFPTLSKHGIPEAMIGGSILNEVRHRGDPKDPFEDESVRKNGTVIDANGEEQLFASVGPQQMQVRHIRRLVEKYPQLTQFKDDPVREAIKPENAPLFVAAYWTEQIENLRASHPELKITPEVLAYSYNSDVYSRPTVSGDSREYKAVSSVDKLAKKLDLPRSIDGPGWEKEPIAKNTQIIRASKIVADIMEATRDVQKELGLPHLR